MENRVVPEVGLETRRRIDSSQVIDSIARTVRTIIGFGGFSVQNRVQVPQQSKKYFAWNRAANQPESRTGPDCSEPFRLRHVAGPEPVDHRLGNAVDSIRAAPSHPR